MADMFADYKKELMGKENTAPEPTASSAQDGKFEYLHRGAFTMLKVRMNAGERMKAESDAMVAMSPNIRVEGKLEGGVLGGLGRMLTGEKFFFQTLTAEMGPGEVYLAPAIPGGSYGYPPGRDPVVHPPEGRLFRRFRGPGGFHEDAEPDQGAVLGRGVFSSSGSAGGGPSSSVHTVRFNRWTWRPERRSSSTTPTWWRGRRTCSTPWKKPHPDGYRRSRPARGWSAGSRGRAGS